MTLLPSVLSLLVLAVPHVSAATNGTTWGRTLSRNTGYSGISSLDTLGLQPPNRPGRCPPCFNCMLPAFQCGQYGECNTFNGQCNCPDGWGGVDCLTPQCDSLSDGERRRLREDGQECECKDGWGGINCNVCKTDQACVGFPLPGRLPAEPEDEGGHGPEVANMTCYKGGETVFANHQMCDVTNRKILDMLPDRPPQVTFSCNRNSSTCSFQFWTKQVESFYCGLQGCESKLKVGPVGSNGKQVNETVYDCEKVRCNCVPGRFICGEDGSVDIGEFLTESIRGPATFSCKTGQGCKFEEPAMNELIDSIFGDNHISLQCYGGECLHYSQVPGYIEPEKPDNTLWLALSAGGALLVVILVSLILWYAGRSSSSGLEGQIKLPDNEAAKLMSDHVPASLHFSGISYTLNGRRILDNVEGVAKPGQVMAIMGASGAGKSTFLDILARKSKRGSVGTSGKVLVNGREVKDEDFKAVMGFVDQEDTLMGTLTVYETVLYSALLRLPREMSYEAKKWRTLETMSELGILGIKDMRIGESGKRSISGGEKRRVSIACELVTSPSILFLDEPTSGLDAYNAFNVIDCLVSLAKDYNRTVIFTIHQPRSNIVAMFDSLVLLSKGRVVYSGEMAKVGEYFKGIGKGCPEGYNIADYLIDMTVNAAMGGPKNSESRESVALESGSDNSSNMGDEERGFGRRQTQGVPLENVRSVQRVASTSSNDQPAPQQPQLGQPAEPSSSSNDSLAQRRSSIASSTGKFLKHKTSQLLEAVTPAAKVDAPISDELRELVESYERSEIRREILDEGERLARAAESGSGTPAANAGPNVTGAEEVPDVALETTILRGRKRASYGTQFRILSGRAFKNLYRDPALLAAHYLSSILLALICGFFYHDVSDDIKGFQNRLGVFFFTLALFGFSCLSSLGLFAGERILFMRERANGYYSSFTYFSSKVLFDILPLRLVPPLIFGGIVYGLIGLVPTVPAFWKFMLTLVLFNLTTASVVLWLSIAFANINVASLTGTLVMLYNLLFTGLLINRESVTPMLQWLHTVSFFHAAFEALAVNELRYLQLKEHRYGVDIELPAATILSTFGLRSQSFWWPNISLLAIFFVLFTSASYLTLHFFVKEKR